MTSSPLPVHPVLGCAHALGEALKDVADVEPVFMTSADKQAALLELTKRAAQLEELRLRVLASADDVAQEQGMRDAAAWLAHAARVEPEQARGDLRLARALDRDHPAAREAMRDGVLSRAQAEVVVRSVHDLPRSLDLELRRSAEAHLVGEALRFAPRALRRLGRRLLEVVAPEEADAHELRLLEREEVRASTRTSLTTRRRGDGTTDIRIRCADAVADRLLTYLHAFTNPRQPGMRAEEAVGTDRRPYDQRLGHAFGAFLEAVDPRRMPLHGGDATTLIVTIDIEALRSGLGTALVGDTVVTAAEARRLACQASILPLVLGGESEPLDLGRAQRLFQPPQRKAMAVRDRTCRAVGCDIPAAWCEAHHAGAPWSRGGETNIADGVLLCSWHHHRAHDHRYETDRMTDGRVRFHRRR